MAYKELVNVANGVKAQIDACISALDKHDNPPEEVDHIISMLDQAAQVCDTIVRKAGNEPDVEQPAKI